MFKEIKLLQDSLAGDRNAFEQIVAQYQSPVCAITFSGTGRMDVSEELAQETFVSAWENLHQLRDLNGFRSWLYSIARNALRNYYRRRQPLSLDACPAEAMTEDAQNPPEILMRKEEQAMLEEAILRLPPKYREPLVMFCRQQRSMGESAIALGLTEATFRTRLHRARRMLREDIAERLENALGRTGPREEFTKAVMAAIGGVPVALAAGTDAAASVTAGHANASRWIPTVLTGAGVKIAVVAAVIAVGSLVYTHADKDRAFAPRPAAVSPVGDRVPETPVAIPGDQSLSAQATGSTAIRIEAGAGEPRPIQEAAGAEKRAETPVPTVAETIVTGTVLDRNTLAPISGARVGFKPMATLGTDSKGRFRLSYEESREEAFLCTMAPGYAFEQIVMRVKLGERHDVVIKLEPGLTLAGRVVDPNHNPVANSSVLVLGTRLQYPAVTTDADGQFRVEGLDTEDASVHVVVEHADYGGKSSAVSLERGRLGEEIMTEIVLAPRQHGAALSGRVTNAKSEPVAQAVVGYYRRAISTQTDPQGRYSLPAMDEDSFSLYVSHPLYPVHVKDITLSPGEKEATVDVQLANPQRLSGRVADEQGRPVVDAAIGVESHAGKEVWGLEELYHSDSEGRFVVPNAPSQGEYRLLVLGDGIHRATQTIRPGQSECLVVVSRSGRMYGRVVDAVTGDPVPCFRAVMERGSRIPIWWAVGGLTFASEKGYFDTGGMLELVIGTRSPLTIYADGYDPLTLDAVPVRPVSQDPDRTVFHLQRDERRSTLYVGRVVNAEGQPVQGAEVGFRQRHVTDDRRGFSRTATDASGIYTVSSVSPREQIIYARAPGYAPTHCRMSELLLETPGVLADVVLGPPAAVCGYVYDEFGRAVANAKIVSGSAVPSAEEIESEEMVWDVLWPQTQTDQQGYYQLTGLPVGGVRVQVLGEGHGRIAPQTVTVLPGQSVELNFGDRGGFVISGSVANGENLLGGVDVQLKAMDKSLKSHYDRTNASGLFKLIHVPAGKYVFAAIRPRDGSEAQFRDPNDTSHVLYEVMDIQDDLDLLIDFRTRSIRK